jgi:hypothetical protein
LSNLPLTYPDLVCDVDLDPFASETTSDLQNLIQDVMHIISELPGSNPDDLKRGVGIQSILSGSSDALTKASKAIEASLGNDDRIQAVSCSIASQDNATFPYLIRVDIQVAGSVIGVTYGYSSVTGLVNQI